MERIKNEIQLFFVGQWKMKKMNRDQLQIIQFQRRTDHIISSVIAFTQKI